MRVLPICVQVAQKKMDISDIDGVFLSIFFVIFLPVLKREVLGYLQAVRKVLGLAVKRVVLQSPCRL